jgi:hypothetical protein
MLAYVRFIHIYPYFHFLKILKGQRKRPGRIFKKLQFSLKVEEGGGIVVGGGRWGRGVGGGWGLVGGTDSTELPGEGLHIRPCNSAI